ncbi:hypothetical protein GCM10010234_41430 [Streptomyces hawaiiensis]
MIRTTKDQATASSRTGSNPPPDPVGAGDRAETKTEVRKCRIGALPAYYIRTARPPAHRDSASSVTS